MNKQFLERSILNLSLPWVNFPDADLELIKEISKYGTKLSYKEEIILINSGQKVEGLYLLTEGQAPTRIFTPKGDEKTFFIFKPICIFGDVPYFNDSVSNLEIKINAGSTLIFFDKITVNKLRSTNIRFCDFLLQSVARKAKIVANQLQDMFYLTPEERVCKMLLLLGQEQGITVGNELVINITQEEIANIVGLHRVTVARICSKLKSLGIIKNNHKTKKVLKLNTSALISHKELYNK